jgi:hypothetical protein
MVMIMNKTEKLTLIEGVFLHDEAKDILMNIFSAKVNFHKVKNIFSNERFGKDDETARKRIPSLINEMVKLHELLAEAKDNNKKLVVKSEIIISLVDA